jgi:hypothetical protein
MGGMSPPLIFLTKVFLKSLGGFNFFLYLCGGRSNLTDEQESKSLLLLGIP